MNRILRFAIMLSVALTLVPFLPLYIELTMTRSIQAGNAGDVIEWGWRLRTLIGYWADYNYFSPNQSPALWLGVNIILAVIYALLIALTVDRVIARRKRA